MISSVWGEWLTWLFAVVLVAGCHGKLPYEGKSVAELEAMVRGDDPARQVQGARGLGLLGADARAAAPALVDLLKSPHLPSRQQAAHALGKIGPDAKAATPGLVEALRDPEWTVRRNAAMALGEIDARDATAELQKAAADRDRLVSKAAQDALRKLEGR